MVPRHVLPVSLIIVTCGVLLATLIFHHSLQGDPGNDGSAVSKEVAAKAELEALGARIRRFEKNKSGKAVDPFYDVNLYESKVADEQLKYLKDIRSIKSLYLGYSEITAEGMKTIGEIDSLEILLMGECTDEFVAQFRGLVNLYYLGLSNTAVTDKF